jgi:hypothetical protein
MHFNGIRGIFETQGSNERALEIHHNRDVLVLFKGSTLDVINDLPLLMNLEIVHVDSSDIHALADHLSYVFFVFGHAA